MLFAMRSGFSLIELSVVLVIIGLVAGSVVGGQAVLNASARRSVITEYQKYNAAVFAFQEKYSSLPGDIRDATTYFGTAATCPGYQSSPSTTAATCNGNGNRQINATGGTANEEYRFWQQLAAAGLIDGSYVGVSNHINTYDQITTVAGWNVPISKFNSGLWRASYIGTAAYANTQYIDGDYGNVFFLSIGLGSQPGALFNPNDLWNIDLKIDDGEPGTGILRAPKYHNNCHDMTITTTATMQTADYRRNDVVACAAIFLMTM